MARKIPFWFVCTFCGREGGAIVDRMVTDVAGDPYHAMCARRANATIDD